MLVWNFKFAPSASPKILSLNQDHPSKSCFFWSAEKTSAERQEIDDPRLPRKRNVSNHYEEGQAPAEFVSAVQEQYHQVYIKQFDMVANSICDRFQRKYYIETLQTMELLLLKVFH